MLSDEIYTRLVYDGQVATSIFSNPSMRDRTILVDGFSKTYCMTGTNRIRVIEAVYCHDMRIEQCMGYTKELFCDSHAGWRLGWMVMPAWLAARGELLLVHSIGCTATFTQAAGVAALTGPQDSVEDMVEDYTQKRDFVVQAMNAIPGVTCEVCTTCIHHLHELLNCSW